MAVLRLTPLEKEFRKLYIHFEFIMDKKEKYCSGVRETGEEYRQNYLDMLKVINSNPKTHNLYQSVIYELLGQIDEGVE
jgi:hypothetical protein